MADKKKILASCPMFDSLPPEAIDTLAEMTQLCAAPQGEAIIIEETVPEGLYIIVEGEVDYMKRMDELSSLFLSRHGKGDVFGFTCIMDKKNSLITAIAATPVQYLLLSSVNFWKFTGMNPLYEHRIMEKSILIHSIFLRQVTVRFREFLAKILNNPETSIS